MARAKIAITIDPRVLAVIDDLVRAGVHPNRSKAIEAAVEDRILRLSRSRLAAECAKMDPAAERAMAEEGSSPAEDGWPEY